jgi:hypothetical protein
MLADSQLMALMTINFIDNTEESGNSSLLFKSKEVLPTHFSSIFATL